MMSHTKTFSMNNMIISSLPVRPAQTIIKTKLYNQTFYLSIAARILHHLLKIDPSSKLISYKVSSAGKGVMTGSQGPLNPA